MGRPITDFDQCSDKAKRKKTEILRQSFSTSQIMFNASMKQRLDGDEDSAKLLKEIESTTATRGKRIRDAWKSHKQKQIQKQMTTDEALALIISASLSVYQYKLLRKQAIKLNHDIYPSYNTVLASKK